MSDWIGDKDRLPKGVKRGKSIIAYIPNENNHKKNRVEELYYMHRDNWFTQGYYTRKVIGVTHWMLLPDPPK